MKQFKVTFTPRPLRCLYIILLTGSAFYLFGGLGAALVAAASVDLQVHR